MQPLLSLPGSSIQAELAHGYVLCLNEWLYFYVCPIAVNRQKIWMHSQGLCCQCSSSQEHMLILLNAAIRKGELLSAN